MSSPETESNQIEELPAIADDSPLFIDGVEVAPDDRYRLYIDTPFKLYRGQQIPARSYPSDLVVKSVEEHLEAINGMYDSFNGKQIKQLKQLPADHLAMLEHDLLEMDKELDLNELNHQSIDIRVNDVVSGYQRSPRGTAELAATVLEKMQAALETDDTAARERLGDELIAILDRGAFVSVDDEPAAATATEPDDLIDRLNNGKTVELGDRKTVSKIELQWLYDVSPKPIKDIVELLYCIGGRKKELAPVLVLFAYNLASNLMGKELVGMNDGAREYYGNTAFIALLDSGANKFFVGLCRKALESVLMGMPDRPSRTMGGTDEAAEVIELRRKYGLDTGKTVGLIASSATLNGVYQFAGHTVSTKEMNKMTGVERQAMKADVSAAMCLDPGALMMADEAHMTIDKLVGAGSSGSCADMGEVLKLFDSGEPFDKATGVHGWQIVYDACVGLLGCSQPTTWLKMIGDMEGAATSGLVGRIQILNMADCASVKIKSLRITPTEATNRLYLAIGDLIRLATHEKHDEGKIVCDFGTDTVGGEDWAGKLYQEVADELGPVYDYLVEHYGFEGDAGCKGKVFWHSIKLTMTHCYCGLSPKEIRRIRLDGSLRVPAPADIDVKGNYVHERQHLQHVTPKLRDKEVFKGFAKLMIQMMHVNLANLDVDMDMSKLWRDLCRHCSQLGKDATITELRKKTIRKKVGRSSVKLRTDEIKQELSEMITAKVIGEYHLDDGEGFVKTVYYPIKDIEAKK